jgi:hypothetical protein
LFLHVDLVNWFAGQALRVPNTGEGATGAIALQLRREDPRLNARRWSVSEEAPLQNQFSECPCFGRSCIEEQRRRRGMRVRDEREFIDAKIDGGKFCVVARPAFRYHRNNCA